MKLTHKITIAVLSITTILSLLFALIQGQQAVRQAEAVVAARQMAEEQRDRAIEIEMRYEEVYQESETNAKAAAEYLKALEECRGN